MQPTRIAALLACLLMLAPVGRSAPAGESAAGPDRSLRPQPRPVSASTSASTPAPAAGSRGADLRRPFSREDAARARGTTVTALAGPLRPLGRALGAMRDGDWESALKLARGDGQAAVDVIEWHRLRAGEGTAEEALAFLARNPDWPGLPYLRRNAEPSLLEARPATVLRFFEGAEPQTAEGALALFRALRRAGRQSAANAVLVRAWTSLPMDEAIEKAILDEARRVVAPHHRDRLDAMLWQGALSDARRMLPRVSRGLAALGRARIALAEDARGIDRLINAVPRHLADDPGLAHARFLWRLKKGRRAAAIALLRARSTSAEALGRPQAWAAPRLRIARDLLSDGEPRTAYDVAARHHLDGGSTYAQLEWLAGYIALKELRRPADAVRHFRRFRDAVATPVSLGRAGYWLGRALEAAGDRQKAAEAYREGARYQTSFYGLLAAEKAGVPFDAALAGNESFAPWQDADFRSSSVFRAAVLLLAAGEEPLAVRFFTHLAESLGREDIGRLADLASDLDQPYLQVMLGKRAARYGISLPGPYFALHPMARRNWPVPVELVLAISRRESEFYPEAVSSVGARGLMQVMPATAREMAGKLGLPYAPERLTADWVYNARLGTAYIAELAGRFGGNPVLIAVAYNAGPSRAERWLARNGDFRRGRVDVIDWIEAIPFTETRNYVMRVTESLPIYRARLGLDPLPRPFSRMLRGSAYAPLTPQGE